MNNNTKPLSNWEAIEKLKQDKKFLETQIAPLFEQENPLIEQIKTEKQQEGKPAKITTADILNFERKYKNLIIKLTIELYFSYFKFNFDPLVYVSLQLRHYRLLIKLSILLFPMYSKIKPRYSSETPQHKNQKN